MDKRLDTHLGIILHLAEKWADGGSVEIRIVKKSKDILLEEIEKLQEKAFKYDELNK